MLRISKDVQEWRKETAPVLTAELEHRLAAIKGAVMVPVFRVPRIVVGLKGMTEDPVPGFACRFRSVLSTKLQADDSRPNHSAAAIPFIARQRINESTLVDVERTLD